MFPIKIGFKKGDALSPLLFKFAVKYSIMRVQVNKEVLKLNGMHNFLVYADDDNILVRSLHTVQKNIMFSSC
jgi:hypothetical protein